MLSQSPLPPARAPPFSFCTRSCCLVCDTGTLLGEQHHLAEIQCTRLHKCPTSRSAWYLGQHAHDDEPNQSANQHLTRGLLALQWLGPLLQAPEPAALAVEAVEEATVRAAAAFLGLLALQPLQKAPAPEPAALAVEATVRAAAAFVGLLALQPLQKAPAPEPVALVNVNQPPRAHPPAPPTVGVGGPPTPTGPTLILTRWYRRRRHRRCCGYLHLLHSTHRFLNGARHFLGRCLHRLLALLLEAQDLYQHQHSELHRLLGLLCEAQDLHQRNELRASVPPVPSSG